MPNTHQMRLFIFQSEQNANLYALTLDNVGSNLPAWAGPWTGSCSEAPREVLRGKTEIAAKAVRAAIDSRGFYLSRPDGVAW
jgi:hypothetical protein